WAGSEAPLGPVAVPLQSFSALAAPTELGVDQSPAGEATCLRHRNPSVLRSLSVSGTQPWLSVAPYIAGLVTNCNLCRKKPCDQGFYPSEVQPSESSRDRSEEHTSELQSRENLVCRLLLEKKNKT